MNSIRFCDLTFRGLTPEGILRNSEKEFTHVITVGAEFIVEARTNTRLRQMINNNFATFDGTVPYFFAKRQNRGVDFEKISGADYIYNLCDYAQKHAKSMYLLGGYPDSNAESVRRLEAMGIRARGFVTGFIPYPFPQERMAQIAADIEDFKPDFVLVALGMPKQEYMIDELRPALDRCGTRLAMGCGGTFEVFSGLVKRAPRWVQEMGLESIYRVAINPTPDRFRRFFNKCAFLKYAMRKSR